MALRQANAMSTTIQDTLKRPRADFSRETYPKKQRLAKPRSFTDEYHLNSRKLQAEPDAEKVVTIRTKEPATQSPQYRKLSLSASKERTMKDAVIHTFTQPTSKASSMFQWSKRKTRIEMYNLHLLACDRICLEALPFSEWFVLKTEEYIAATNTSLQAQCGEADSSLAAENFLLWLKHNSTSAQVERDVMKHNPIVVAAVSPVGPGAARQPPSAAAVAAADAGAERDGRAGDGSLQRHATDGRESVATAASCSATS